MVTSLRPARPGSAAALGRAEAAAVTLLCALLPDRFRSRQHGEWTGDLLAMTAGRPGLRWRYLAGAARTLPSLRRQVSRGADGAGIDVPTGARATAAWVLLFGLIWPIVSWVLFVPLRYYALDIPGRLQQTDWAPAIDPMDVWPFEGTPGWLLPLWVVLHFGALLVVVGGPFLVAAIGILGAGLALLRRRRPVRRATLGVLVLITAVISGAWVAAIRIVQDIYDKGYTTGLAGITAVVLAVRSPELGRGARAGLLMLGIAAISVLVAYHTGPGRAMTSWFLD